MKADLQAWRALPPEDRRGLARAWACLLIARTALQVLPLPRVEALLERLAGGSSPGEIAIQPARFADLVDIAARHHLLSMSCLPRSLALKALLQRQGVAADLRIGVYRENGALRAHAWVEDAGVPLGESEEVGQFFLPLLGTRSAA